MVKKRRPGRNDQRADVKNPNNHQHKKATDNRSNQKNSNHSKTKKR